jgi:two-component system, NtrC family, sensor histidine kinase HydH
VVPILECAFRFGLKATVAVAAVADVIVFYWVWRYFELHPPLRAGEYFEAGTLSIILLIVAALVSAIVQNLRRKQEQLETTHEQLLHQEKLAAVGRFSSALAHEIRNPAAMISSSLATARTLEGADREQMLEIATKESSRLVALTNELLAYARPRKPAACGAVLRDTILYVADACHAQAAAKGVSFDIHAATDLQAEYDEALLQRALMNLLLNAVDASPQGGVISLDVNPVSDGHARIDVENSGGPMPPLVVERLF